MKVAIACRLYKAQQEASQILIMCSPPNPERSSVKLVRRTMTQFALQFVLSSNLQLPCFSSAMNLGSGPILSAFVAPKKWVAILWYVTDNTRSRVQNILVRHLVSDRDQVFRRPYLSPS